MALTHDAQHPAYQLLTRAHSPATASTLFVDKVLHKPLILRPTSPDPSSQDARAARRLKRIRAKEQAAKKQKPKRLSAKEKRQLSIYEISKEDQRYDLFVPLHNLWLGYIREILGLSGPEPGTRSLSPTKAGPMLGTADYHGALMEVVRCRCPDRVGIRGIVVKDTRFTLEIITKANVIKVIPKERTMFRFEVPYSTEKSTSDAAARTADSNPCYNSYAFELNGSLIQHRPVDRAIRKIKPSKALD